MSESQYKKVVDSLIKAINDYLSDNHEKRKNRDFFEIKLPIKKIDDIFVNSYFKVHRNKDVCYIKIHISINYIITRRLLYRKYFKHNESSENKLYNFFNDLENLKLNYRGILSVKKDDS